ncbi:uncharacterized protein LOC127834886 isoform X2 [Dreissena polymorpha]|uniref:uncharacterized protein LOC127834886 isoform X2 n=1 Tax=Dreissena polymorpha TaxID=45954 RepID=UPI0022645896|nr:uncharacterized protein LOC127834886 isoform X2 [Dreissena polymorpha]
MTIATLDYDSATSYTITVTCTDAINPVTSSRTINLADDKPVFSGLPATLSPARNDGFQTATLLCTFSVTDANDQSISTCLIQEFKAGSVAVRRHWGSSQLRTRIRYVL